MPVVREEEDMPPVNGVTEGMAGTETIFSVIILFLCDIIKFL